MYSQVLPHKVAVVYVVPTDVAFNQAVLDTLKVMTAEMQGWYQLATGGKTFEMLYPDTVITYMAQHPRQYYKDNGDWWNSLLPEIQASGAAPIWSPGYITAIWAHGAGWQALGAQFCGKDCGTALLGVEIIPQFNNPLYSGGVCPGGSGVSAWPCTPKGAYAHELGHTLGLPHPSDIPVTNPVASHSVMQTHWNYPNFAPSFESPWGFLSIERQVLAQNPFMKTNIDLVQVIEHADVVNLPVTGPVPKADFSFTVTGNEVRFNNKSSGATSYYWTFGDQSVSNAANPTHLYLAPGTYKVRLRANSTDQMMGIDSAIISINQSQQIHSFTLIDAVKDTDIMTITDGAVIDLTALGVDKINIRANTNAPAVVKFKLRGEERETRIDDVAPYALKGDDRKGNYYSWKPDKGRYTLSATPHAGTKKHMGAPTGPSYSIRFRITKSKQQHLPAIPQDNIYEGTGKELAHNISKTNNGNFGTGGYSNSGLSGNHTRATQSPGAYWQMKAEAGSNSLCNKISASNGEDNFKILKHMKNGEDILGSGPETVNQTQATLAGSQQMSLYPNPTPDGRLQIQLSDQIQGSVHFSLYSAVGYTLTNGTMEKKHETNLIEFDFSPQIRTAGIYYLLLQSSNSYRLFKVVRN
ncbi:PKD domain-containing protein [Adhaeribacter sp. BT258]|uniref:PKD domain-containing protein n=1 Tax=Adhaeribacter terrigena TaxID=2793070 RepID=A0ABS1C2I0_9BACT|nr:PKD domain-containing protein [Adhaeribacter terrigena]MBK0403372.1 PKD domain-containing protein [Adhaeribacter terrigena]